MTTSSGTSIHAQVRLTGGLPVRFVRRGAPAPGEPVPSPASTAPAGRTARTRLTVDDAWCEALFASALQRSAAPAAESVAALFAIGLLAVLLATLTSSTLTATTVLAGVAIVIAIGECAQFIVLGPIVADLAPPHLFGRYMSLYGLSFTAGVALGPAVGGALLAASPDAVWWGGALAAALTGAGLLRLGDRIPDPLLQAQCPPPQAVTAADMDSAGHS